MNLKHLDYDAIVQSVMIQLRGKKSQNWVDLHLKHNKNKTNRIESGLTKATWNDFVSLCQLNKKDLKPILESHFLYFGQISHGSHFLKSLFHNNSTAYICEKLELSITQGQRLLTGKGKIPLALIFRAIQQEQYRLLNFLNCICDIKSIDVLSRQVSIFHELTKLYLQHPTMGLLTNFLEIPQNQTKEKSNAQNIASTLEIPTSEVEAMLNKLKKIKVLSFKNGVYNIEYRQYVELYGINFEDRIQFSTYWLKRITAHLDKIDKKQDACGLLFYLSNDELETEIKNLVNKFYFDLLTLTNKTPASWEKAQYIKCLNYNIVTYQ